MNTMGWYALTVSILANVPIEKAFNRLDGLTNVYSTEEDVEDMIKLKPEHTYEELADMFGIDPTRICRYVKKSTKP